MKKGIIISAVSIALVVLVVALLFAVKPPKSDENYDSNTDTAVQPTDENGNPYFSATVISVSESTVLVEPFEDEVILKTADRITVNTQVVSTIAVPKLAKGDEIRVVYNGTVQETYPAHIPSVFAIYKIS